MNDKDVKNKIAYFKKVVKNMDKKDTGKKIYIDHNEVITQEIEDTCYTMDEYFCDNLDWIELIENIDLHKALKSLSEEEQTLLTYLFYKGKTQKEVAKIYGIAQKNISVKMHKILIKIRIILFKI